MKKLFEIKNLRCSYDKKYVEGKSKVVLEINDLVIPRGKKIFIVGESGVGKSTILETLGLMNNTIVPDDNATFRFFDKDENPKDLAMLWYANSDKKLSDFRLKNYSFIFQSTNMMHNFTAYENVTFTRMLQGFTKYSCYRRARKLLDDLGLEHVDEARLAHELSGGQQQRLAFARAILPDFSVLFGDEPTGNLDGVNAVKVMEILSKKMTELDEASAIIVTHDMHLAVTFADVIIKIRKQVRDKKNPNDEDITYGVIDESCVFTPHNEDFDGWTNGSSIFPTDVFEDFLRRK